LDQGTPGGRDDFERLFDALATAASVGVWRSLGDDGLSYVSDRLVEIVQAPRERLLGLGWLDFVHAEDLDRMVAVNEHAHATGEDIDVEYRIVRGDGETRWLDSLARRHRARRGR
jgi:PAS domain S-box-containing protein